MKKLLYSLINLLFGIDVYELIRKRDSLQQELEYTQNKVLERDNNLLRASKEQKLLDRKQQKLETTLASLQKQLLQTEKQNKTLKYEAEVAKKQWQEEEQLLMTKNEELTSKLTITQKEAKVLSESKLELTKQIDELLAHSTLLKEKHRSVNGINKKLEDQNNSLKSAANNDAKRIAKLASSLEEATNEKSALQKDIGKLQTQIDELKEERKKAAKQLADEPTGPDKPTTKEQEVNAPVKEEGEKSAKNALDGPKKLGNSTDIVPENEGGASKDTKKSGAKTTPTTPTSGTEKKEKKITHQATQQKLTQRLLDGTLIEHTIMNVGQRVTSAYRPEEAIFEYSGKFLFDMKKRNQPDAEKFAHVFYPKLDTPVLKWHKSSSNITSGVTEPLLIKALEKLTHLVPEIEVHQNTSLSIINRNYSYRPDIAIVWQKHNLYIDLEVDEPYDIVTRKPIHYKASGDYLRNLYFMSQGWVVIRFSEEQIYKTTDHCVAYIASILKEITKESVFDELVATLALEEQERWSYDKAKELEQEKYRESYLNIEAIRQFEEDMTASIDSTPFAGETPAVDILPENKEHTEYEQIINNKAAKYIRLTLWPTETQYILEDYKQKTELYRKAVVGYDLLNRKNNSFTFDEIMLIEFLDTPFKYPLLEQHNVEDILKIKEHIFEAIYNFNPISIKYEDSNGKISQRNVTHIGYERDSKERFADNIWTNYYSNYSNKDDTARRKLVAYCQLRNEQRSFFDGKIRAIQVYNFRDIGLGHLHSFTEALCHPIRENDMELAHHIVALMPKFIREEMMDVDVVLAGNYAHYLLLTGKTEQALEIYKQHEGLQITDDLDWRQLVLQDFENLKDIADYNQKFEMAKQLLGWN